MIGGVSNHVCLNRAAQWVLMVGMPEVPPFAPYALASDEVPESFRQVDNCAAYTRDNLGEDLKLFLHAQGKWQGYHFATVVFLDRMQARGIALNDINVTALVLHEFGHAIESLAWFKATPQQREAAGLYACTDETDGVLRFHGPAWHRAICHVGYRASMAGWRGGVGNINFAGKSYGLSSGEEYWHVLRSEVDERRHERLVNVLRSPLPKDFAELWAEDTQGVRP